MLKYFYSPQFIKSFAGAFRFNSRGVNIREKLVVFESDDWGAIRTPSKSALLAFKARGFKMDDNIYNNDALESETDLELLFDLLSSIKLSNGSNPKFTTNILVANPDFNKIKQNNYKDYYYEKLFDTYSRYPKHKNNMILWKQGIDQGIVKPQYHGREHLNYKRWLKSLRSGNEDLKFCFEWNSTYSGQGDYNFMEAFDWDKPQDIEEHKTVLEDGIKLFYEYFAFYPKSFIPPCNILDPELFGSLIENKIELLQGSRINFIPTGNFNKYNSKKRNFGKVDKSGLRFNIRNCYFEPSVNLGKNWVDSCLAQISNAFLLNKPAVICTHRINYIGFINSFNRDNSMRQLKLLLNEMIKNWPQIKFITTDQLLYYLN